VIAKNPESANAYFNKALVCEKIGRNKDAIEAYRNFITYATARLGVYVEGARERIEELQKLDQS